MAAYERLTRKKGSGYEVISDNNNLLLDAGLAIRHLGELENKIMAGIYIELPYIQPAGGGCYEVIYYDKDLFGINVARCADQYTAEQFAARHKIRLCPRCGAGYTAPPAISRADNKTEICPHCGQAEAIAAYKTHKDGKQG